MTLSVIVATRFGDDAMLLETWTAEGGFFENATVAALVALAIGCLLAAWRFPSRTRQRWLLVALGLIVMFGAMEEVSWGQRVIGFETPATMEHLNRQGEFNIHNVLDSQIFSALVHTPVYIFFIYLPLLFVLFPGVLDWRILSWTRPLVFPDVHNILIFCFGTALHAWWVPITLGDSIACCFALVLCVVALWRCPAFRQPWALVHWLAVAGATAVFAVAHQIYRYDNMQYEIRELIVVLGVAYWLTLWVDRALQTYSKTAQSR